MALQIQLNKRVKVTFLRLVQQWLSARPHNIIGQALTLASQGILALLQRLQKIVSLKLKLSSSPLYLLSSVYIFVRFVNSLLKPQLQFYLDGSITISRLIQGQFYYINKIGYTGEIGCVGSIIGRIGFVGGIISRVGFIVGKVEIGVLMVLVLVLVLAKLFLRRQLIRPKLNFPLVAICSLILGLVYFIESSSYKVLKRASGIIVFLYFLTHIL